MASEAPIHARDLDAPVHRRGGGKQTEGRTEESLSPRDPAFAPPKSGASGTTKRVNRSFCRDTEKEKRRKVGSSWMTTMASKKKIA